MEISYNPTQMPHLFFDYLNRFLLGNPRYNVKTDSDQRVTKLVHGRSEQFSPSLPLSLRYPSSPNPCAATLLLRHRPSTTRAPACLLPTGIVPSSPALPPLSFAARPPLLLPHHRSPSPTDSAGAPRQGRGGKPAWDLEAGRRRSALKVSHEWWSTGA
jgi:hypothetical protein